MSKKNKKMRTNYEVYKAIRKDWGNVKPYTRVEQDKRRKNKYPKKNWEEQEEKEK